MKEYKWTLRKSSKKEICPSCGKRRFVPFVLTADPSILAGEGYGRCDRENSCGYFKYPEHQDNKELTNVKCENENKKKEVIIKKTIGFSLPDFVVNSNNSLFLAYKELLSEEILKKTMEMYHIGTGFDGRCVFPQFDGNWMRTAKSILYNENGHRKKDVIGDEIKWWHKKRDYIEYIEDKQLRQCFFGQHLVAKYKNAEIYIVESEKTAVLMTAVNYLLNNTNVNISEKFIFLGCGGSQMLKGSISFECLKNRKVFLVPDDGAFVSWHEIGEKEGFHTLNPINFNCAQYMQPGFDVWDCIEYQLKNNLFNNK